ETLGRWFEARGWWTLALRDSAHAAEARAALTRLDRIQRALAATQPTASGAVPLARGRTGVKNEGDSRASSQPPHPASGHPLPEGRGQGAGAGRLSGTPAPSRTVADAL